MLVSFSENPWPQQDGDESGTLIKLGDKVAAGYLELGMAKSSGKKSVRNHPQSSESAEVALLREQFTQLRMIRELSSACKERLTLIQQLSTQLLEASRV